MILADTNIFLEILLEQDGKEKCKRFLAANIDQLFLSDFSLHSIGLILFKYNKHEVFKDFITDILPHVTLITLSKKNYQTIDEVAKSYNLDFDDAYQFCTGKEFNLEIATQDKDFNRVKSEISVLFI